MSAQAPIALVLAGVRAAIERREVLRGIDLRISQGELVVLLGANGAGKTSLMRCALGLAPLSDGEATIGDTAAHRLTPVERAKLVSYLPQTRSLAWPVRVIDVVSLGRYAYGATPGRLADEDRRAVNDALAACRLTELIHRRADALSGGELARVHLARALAAEAPLLVADEPVAALDPRYQFGVMHGLQRYVREAGGGAFVVLHDIALAARFADRLVWLQDGRVVADGPPRTTLTPQRLRDVFAIEGRVSEDPDGLTVRIVDALAP
ncbi:MAG: ABC transporter ATP-binding protein [Pseudomonadota bacterium]